MSENKEIKECIKELDACYDKLYKRFCEGKFCAECPLDVLYGECMQGYVLWKELEKEYEKA